jgi:hypothetical protein
VFQVVDGTSRISSEERRCATSKDEYRDYLLVMEFRLGGETFGKRAEVFIRRVELLPLAAGDISEGVLRSPSRTTP